MPDRAPTPTWTFARGTERLKIQRFADRELRVVTGLGEDRRFDFADISELTAFQIGFEDALLRDGWTLTEFSPERRSGRDRRVIPRHGRERRRRRFPRSPPQSRK